MSSTPGDPCAARKRILADHACLRALKEELAALARRVVDDEKLRPDVRRVMAQLRTELEGHLRFEESVLRPILLEADVSGPVRVEQMAKEHAGQHAVLLALTEDAREGVRTASALADEMLWFVESLDRHMREEETMLLSAEAPGGDSLFPADFGV